jgi:hypothetical protein
MRPSAVITTGRSVGRGVEPALLGDVGGDGVRLRAIRDDGLPRGRHLGEVDVEPVDGGWRRDPGGPRVEPGTQVDSDRVRVAGDEIRRHLVDPLGAQRHVEDEVGVEIQPLVVVVERADDLVGDLVAQDGMRRAVVQSPAAQREEQAVLDRSQRRQHGRHRAAPRCRASEPPLRSR